MPLTHIFWATFKFIPVIGKSNFHVEIVAELVPFPPMAHFIMQTGLNAQQGRTLLRVSWTEQKVVDDQVPSGISIEKILILSKEKQKTKLVDDLHSHYRIPELVVS